MCILSEHCVVPLKDDKSHAVYAVNKGEEDKYYIENNHEAMHL